jgi:hypothetical protein
MRFTCIGNCQPRSNAGETGGIIASSDLAGRETHLVSLLQVEHPLESASAREKLLRAAISVGGSHVGKKYIGSCKLTAPRGVRSQSKSN